MKKVLIVLLMLILLCGCSSEKETGRFAIISNGYNNYIVVAYYYNDDETTFEDIQLNLSNIEKYIDDSIELSHTEGIAMNKIDGLFSYQRQYIHWEPLKISSDNIAKANKKQIKMICTDQNGNTHEILLKYDENIKLIP